MTVSTMTCIISIAIRSFSPAKKRRAQDCQGSVLLLVHPPTSFTGMWELYRLTGSQYGYGACVPTSHHMEGTRLTELS